MVHQIGYILLIILSIALGTVGGSVITLFFLSIFARHFNM